MEFRIEAFAETLLPRTTALYLQLLFAGVGHALGPIASYELPAFLGTPFIKMTSAEATITSALD